MSFGRTFARSFGRSATHQSGSSLPAAKLKLAPVDSTVTQDSGKAFTATIQDVNGGTVDSTADVTFASTVAGAWTPSDTVAAVAGVASATFTPSAFGTATIDATSTGLTAATTQLTVEELLVATYVAILPQSAVIDDTQSLNLIGRLFDQNFNLIEADNDITFTPTVAGSFSPTSPVTAVDGDASTVYTPSTTGTGTITVSGSGLTGVPDYDVCALTVNATGSVVTTLTKVSGDNTVSTPSTAVNLVIEVQEDGSPVQGRAVTATIASGTGTLDSAQKLTDVSGQATFVLTTAATTEECTVDMDTADATTATYTVQVPDRIVRFLPASDEGDAGGTVAYRVRVAADAGNKTWDVADLAIAYDEKAAGFSFNSSTGYYEWDLSNATAFPTIHGSTREGLFDLGITSVDAAGNDSGEDGTSGFLEIEDAYFWY